MVEVIDAVCNLWTKEVNDTRPEKLHQQVKYFWESYAKVDQATYAGGTVEDIIRLMDQSGIQKAFLIAADLGIWKIPYEKIFETVSQYANRFYALAGLNPEEGMPGVRRLEKAVRELGFIGAHVYPHWFKKAPNDRIYYPFYAKCVELNIPIQIQIGHSAQTFLPTVAHPMTLDDIAIYFPELKIIGIHIGWPWVEQAIAVALKHPNVYLGTDAHAPKYWDPKFIHFIRTRGKRKVIFGTDFPILSFERAVSELKHHEFSSEIQQLLLRDNAISTYNLNQE